MKIIQFLGFFMILQGVSGAIDHVAVQPLFGVFLNVYNRLVVQRVPFFEGYEVFANLSLAILGVVVVVATERIGRVRG
ncbi:hypothetical protein Misp01_03270 [Microtetraspora sp. NBRC 13810]|uniref:hypothetical protein n=1 Tax=Microtetraspora sp. NBRC 13810 TaxID=3030990 RepID=UPI0024A46741|nr:hypothetical protein [Microtetraspora sp. NBRC 13810]GLW05197.1 hypothetical protein Misp01_03270 [Microtetraspora sp. NBRC 13810]